MPTKPAMRAAEKLYKKSITSCPANQEYMAQIIDEQTGLPELIEACEHGESICYSEYHTNARDGGATYSRQIKPFRVAKAKANGELNA